MKTSTTIPAPCRVRIVKCSLAQGWYKNFIGIEFDVDNAGAGKDYVLWQDYAGGATMWRHISQDDCVRVQLTNIQNVQVCDARKAE